MIHIKCLGGPRDGEFVSISVEENTYPDMVLLHDGNGGRVGYGVTDEYSGPVELFKTPSRLYVYLEKERQGEGHDLSGVEPATSGQDDKTETAQTQGW